MNAKTLVVFASLLALSFGGCSKQNTAPPSKTTSNPKTSGKVGTQKKQPQFAADLKHYLKGGGSFGTGIGKSSFADAAPIETITLTITPDKKNKTPVITLKMKFVEHKDGKDIYDVSRSPGMHAKQVEFSGEAITLFDDKHGRTFLIPRKVK